MKYYIQRLFIIVSLLLISCASTVELPPKPDYGTRTDYPELQKQSGQDLLNSKIKAPEFDNLDEMFDRWSDFYKRENCKAGGGVRISFVVTKDKKIDAPRVVHSMRPACDKVALWALRYLKVNQPSTRNGKPYTAVVNLPFVVR